MSQLSSLLGNEFNDGNSTVDLATFVGDSPIVGIYFSAHWCGPCRGFTPKLKDFYEKLSGEGTPMPIVFGSSDRDAESFASYFAEMPWHAFNFGDERIATLKSKYQVSGIPWLVVLNTKTGELVLNEADTMIGEGSVAYAKWCETAAKL